MPAVELVTVGQRRGFGGFDPGSGRRYAVDVDVASATVTLGRAADLLVERVSVRNLGWVGDAVEPGRPVLIQASAHGRPVAGSLGRLAGSPGEVEVRFAEPQRRIAPGQSVVLYDGDVVLGGGVAV